MTTQAWLGAGTASTWHGAVLIKAEQTASAIDKARGDTEGGDTSIGVALALNVAHHTVEAWTARNITAGGAISVLAFGSSVTKTDAKASAAGAPGEDRARDAPSEDVNGQVESQRSFGDQAAADNGQERRRHGGGGIGRETPTAASASPRPSR